MHLPTAVPRLRRGINTGLPVLDDLPSFLFENGEQGVLYDVSRLSTLFQDSLGTTPATSPSDPIGLLQDLSGNANHASQATAASRLTLRLNATTGCYYAELDGVDDSLATAAIDFTATDTVTVFAGIRKMSDAAIGCVIELSASSAANNGVFALFAPLIAASPRFTYRSKGTVMVDNASAASFAAPVSAVVTGISDISADTCDIRVNGAQLPNSGNQGTGNYDNYPLYIGRRGGASLPFNGHIYCLIVVNRLVTSSEREYVEQYIARRMGVALA